MPPVVVISRLQTYLRIQLKLQLKERFVFDLFIILVCGYSLAETFEKLKISDFIVLNKNSGKSRGNKEIQTETYIFQ